MQYFYLKMKLRAMNLLNNKGMGVIEIILIIVVMIALVVIFHKQMAELIESLFAKVSSNGDEFVTKYKVK